MTLGMMKMSNYWYERSQRETKTARKRLLRDTEKELRKIYEVQGEKLYNELLDVLNKIAEDSADGKLYINDLYRTNRIYELISYFNSLSVKLGNKQISLTEKAIIQTYDMAQRIIGDNTPKSILRPTFVVPSALDTAQIVNQVWCVDGLDFKARVWKSKKALVKDLQNSLGDFIVRGKSPYQVAKGVSERLGVDERAAFRLVRTETAHAQIKGQTDKYKELGFSEGIYKATDPCDECGDLDGKTFSLEEISHLIPRHPNCECSFLLKV